MEENNTPDSIQQWIKDEAEKYAANGSFKYMDTDFSVEHRESFRDGATALYQLLSKKLEEKEQEIAKALSNQRAELMTELDKKEEECQRLKEEKKNVVAAAEFGSYWKQRCEAAEKLLKHVDETLEKYYYHHCHHERERRNRS